VREKKVNCKAPLVEQKLVGNIVEPCRPRILWSIKINQDEMWHDECANEIRYNEAMN